MKRRRCAGSWSCLLAVTLWGILNGYPGVGGLRDVAVNVPVAVAPGDTVTLSCAYDLEGDPLYTVKWYKGRQEFFRYVPKELPHTRVFPLPGVNVDVSQSGANQVVLRDVQLELAGKYRCEVSADAPTFHTEVVASHMHVVYMPEGEPKLTLEKHRYAVGDTLRGNCSSPASSPPTNLTWIVNGRKVNESFTLRHAVRSGDHSSRQVTTIGLELDMDSSTFQLGRVEVQCVAIMFQLYRSEAKVLLEEERPRLASVLGTRESSSPVKESGSEEFTPTTQTPVQDEVEESDASTKPIVGDGDVSTGPPVLEGLDTAFSAPAARSATCISMISELLERSTKQEEICRKVTIAMDILLAQTRDCCGRMKAVEVQVPREQKYMKKIDDSVE